MIEWIVLADFDLCIRIFLLEKEGRQIFDFDKVVTFLERKNPSLMIRFLEKLANRKKLWKNRYNRILSKHYIKDLNEAEKDGRYPLEKLCK